MNESGNIGYRILDDEIHLKRESLSFEITVELNNSTNSNFVLYGFRRTVKSVLSDSLLCLERPGAGNAMFVTDSLGNVMPEEFTIEMHGDDYLQRPVTEDSLLNVFREMRSEYTDGKEVLRSGQKKQVHLKIDMKSNPPIQQLEPGEYLTYFIYYAGDDLTRVVEEGPVKVSLVDETTIKLDTKKYSATVFNGWVRSNKVKLVVE